MGELYYVGLKPSAGSDIENVLGVRTQLDGGVSRLYVQGRVQDMIAGRVTGNPNSAYALEDDVNRWDDEFATVEYYTQMDAGLTPNNAKANPNGVASLVGGKIPLTQIPVLGVGILKGPVPIANTFGGETFDIPLKIAEWKMKTTGMACQPWAFLTASILSEGGLPVIEIRAGNPTQTTYASQVLVAQGYGRSHYYDYQTVEVFVTDPDLNEGQDYKALDDTGLDFYPSTFDMNLTAWVYDDFQGGSHPKVTATASLIHGSAYLARMKL